MCGIAGLVGLDADIKICQSLLKTMERRGPDGNGVAKFDICTLLHSRLAIIDIEGGKQPMCFEWENEVYTITYNGELYNTDEIRDKLIKLGHRFNGHSDTEVVLHAYAQWSDGCLERFNGIFAFGIWEEKSKKLFLARDRMGVKPLFYKIHEKGILFASELKTILAYPTVRAEIDHVGIMEMILLGPGRTPGCGVLKGIQELEPGCCGFYDSGKWNWKRYWKLSDRKHTESFEETAEHVRYLVIDAIRRQMISDVPIGTFLSGGLDSSLISSVCAKELQKCDKQLPTFSVDYDKNDIYFVPGQFQPNADGEYIRLMSEYLHSDHRWTILTPDDLSNALMEATVARDLPGMADVDFSLLLLCKNIRQKVKVALSGECADEIFGGYPWYRDPNIRAIEGFPWSQNLHQRISLLPSKVLEANDPVAYIVEKYRSTIELCDILPDTSAEEKRMKEMMVLNIRWFMQTLLDRKDRMSMYNSLEVRVPFCDHRIAEYLYSVPWEFKNYLGMEKGLLRYALADHLPEAVAYRKKSPYPKTFDPLYTQIMMKRLDDLLNQPNSCLTSILNPQQIRRLLESNETYPWYGQLMRTPQIIAYFLQLDYWLQYYNVDICI